MNVYYESILCNEIDIYGETNTQVRRENNLPRDEFVNVYKEDTNA